MGITSLFPQSIEGWIVFLLLTIGPTIFTTTRLPRDANRKPNPLPALFMLAGTLVFCCTFLGITTYMVRNQNKWYSLIVVIAVIFIGFTVAWKLIQAALVLTGILKAPDDRPLGAILEDDEPEEEDPVPVHTLEEIAQTHDIPQVPPEQPNYHGYKLVLNDLGGQPSPHGANTTVSAWATRDANTGCTAIPASAWKHPTSTAGRYSPGNAANNCSPRPWRTPPT